ncbi:MAG: hypothetical protein O3B42_05855 [Actinomycetota bacterium]|jgi:hypothetical protein|nr:hypothetical protein [Actinomycetota bacterium]
MMETSEQWAWVAFALGATYVGLVLFATSIHSRIKKARQRLEGQR